MANANAFDFPQEVLSETVKLKRKGIWREGVSAEKKEELLNNWSMAVAEVFGVEPPEIKYEPENVAEYVLSGGGRYYKPTNTIFLYRKVSLMTLFVMFSYVVLEGDILDLNISNQETGYTQSSHVHRAASVDYSTAIDWGHSLFNAAFPDDYRSALERGLFRTEI